MFAPNQGFVVLDDSVLLFDTGFSNAYAKSIEDSIACVTDKKIRYIINSHDHSDHIFGNSYFFEKYSRFALRVLGHEVCSRAIRKLGPERLLEYRKSYKSLARVLPRRVVEPNVTYESSFSLALEGRKFVFVHPQNGAHTLGDTMLAIPEREVMFMGDVFLNSFFPNIEDANIEEWSSSLESIDYSTYSRFLPGHGKVGRSKEVLGFASYLRHLSESLLLLDKPTKAEIRSCFEISGTEDWSFKPILERNVDFLMGNLTSAISQI